MLYTQLFLLVVFILIGLLMLSKLSQIVYPEKTYWRRCEGGFEMVDYNFWTRSWYILRGL